jgi:hypothetical protein
MFNIKKINNLEEENNMKHINTVANNLVKFARSKHITSIDFQSYLSVADLIEHHQFRAAQIVIAGLDSMPRDEILKIISEDDRVWNTMFEPLAEGEAFAFYKNKTLTN